MAELLHPADFNRELYMSPIGADGIACIVTGLGGKIEEFTEPRDSLHAAGYDVAMYEYGMDVLKSGDPDNLRFLISNIVADFLELSASYKRRRHAGVSLGALIAHNIHLWDPTAEPSLLATPGVPYSETPYDSVMLRALGITRAYRRHGFTNSQELAVGVDGLDIAADEPPLAISGSIIVLGRLDTTVHHHKARRLIEEWRRAGVLIHPNNAGWVTHDGAIDWFKHNIPLMLDQSYHLLHPFVSDRPA